MKPLELDSYPVEAVMPHFMLTGMMQPRGDFLIFLNDKTYTFFRFDEVEFKPLGKDYQVRGVKREMIALNRYMVAFISLLQNEDAEKVQLLQSNRPMIFYTDWFAIQGNVHISAEAREDDVLDNTKDFFAVTNASVFPIRAHSRTPTREVPLLMLNRHTVYGFHPG